MKIVYDNGETNIKRIPMAYACCDKCEKPILFAIGFVNEPLVNPWNEEEHKYCEKCGAFMDWKTVNIEKQYETFLAEHDKQIKMAVIEEILKKITIYIDEMKAFYQESQDSSFLCAIAEAQKIRRIIFDMVKGAEINEKKDKIL